MQDDIHPDVKKTTIECACGNTFQVESTREDVEVEICSNCHPFYTGKQKIVDKMGQVEKFKQKMEKAGEEEEEESDKAEEENKETEEDTEEEN